MDNLFIQRLEVAVIIPSRAYNTTFNNEQT